MNIKLKTLPVIGVLLLFGSSVLMGFYFGGHYKQTLQQNYNVLLEKASYYINELEKTGVSHFEN